MSRSGRLCTVIFTITFYNLNFYNMKKNMGGLDKFIRLVVAAVIVYLFYAGIVTGTLGIVLLVVAGVFVLTSLVSFCPLYTLLGIKTCKV